MKTKINNRSAAKTLWAAALLARAVRLANGNQGSHLFQIEVKLVKDLIQPSRPLKSLRRPFTTVATIYVVDGKAFHPTGRDQLGHNRIYGGTMAALAGRIHKVLSRDNALQGEARQPKRGGRVTMNTLQAWQKSNARILSAKPKICCG